MNEEIDWKRISEWAALYVCAVYLLGTFFSGLSGMLVR